MHCCHSQASSHSLHPIVTPQSHALSSVTGVVTLATPHRLTSVTSTVVSHRRRHTRYVPPPQSQPPHVASIRRRGSNWRLISRGIFRSEISTHRKSRTATSMSTRRATAGDLHEEDDNKIDIETARISSHA